LVTVAAGNPAYTKDCCYSNHSTLSVIQVKKTVGNNNNNNNNNE